MYVIDGKGKKRRPFTALPVAPEPTPEPPREEGVPAPLDKGGSHDRPDTPDEQQKGLIAPRS